MLQSIHNTPLLQSTQSAQLTAPKFGAQLSQADQVDIQFGARDKASGKKRLPLVATLAAAAAMLLAACGSQPARDDSYSAFMGSCDNEQKTGLQVSTDEILTNSGNHNGYDVLATDCDGDVLYDGEITGYDFGSWTVDEHDADSGLTYQILNNDMLYLEYGGNVAAIGEDGNIEVKPSPDRVVNELTIGCETDEAASEADDTSEEATGETTEKLEGVIVTATEQIRHENDEPYGFDVEVVDCDGEPIIELDTQIGVFDDELILPEGSNLEYVEGRDGDVAFTTAGHDILVKEGEIDASPSLENSANEVVVGCDDDDSEQATEGAVVRTKEKVSLYTDEPYGHDVLAEDCDGDLLFRINAQPGEDPEFTISSDARISYSRDGGDIDFTVGDNEVSVVDGEITLTGAGVGDILEGE